MPIGLSKSSKTTFGKLPALQEQRQFPHARRSIKRKSLPVPSITKRQSTLTQLDFSSSTPRKLKQASPSSSDVDGFDEPRPQSRRKRKPQFNEKDDNQSTMTQFDRGEVPAARRRAKRPRLEMRELEFEADDCPPHNERKPSLRLTTRGIAVSFPQPEDSQVEDDTKREEIPETSELGLDSSQSAERLMSKEIMAVRTPRKPSTRTEVPSSQTPPSTKSSLRSIHNVKSIERSPLKEKDPNALYPWAAKESLTFGNTSMKMLERVRFAARLMKDGAEKNLSPQSSPEKPATPSKPLFRSPQRTPVVQETQLVDFDIESTPKPVPRKLTRTGTVQDSQFEDIDLESPDHYSVDENIKLELGWAVDDSQYAHYNYGPATYDPAYSALDRDAARFAQTQTQRHHVSYTHEDSETDDEDVEDLGDARKLQAATVAVGRNHDGTACKEGGLEQSTSRDTAALPSSPPLLRPSQESVIISTQISPLKEPSADCHQPPQHNIHKDKDNDTQLPPPNTSSPRPPIATPLFHTISSSPLPLPPSSRNAGLGAGSQLSIAGRLPESLEDFSLPPPPPLSSSRRR